MTTKIEWTNETWNPVTGCTPISKGCKNCYARRMARRLAGRYGYPESPRYFDVTLRPDRLDQPLHLKKSRMIFVCSMSDLFHEDVPEQYIISVFARMTALHKHTYQILTKRPERMLNLVSRRMPGIERWENIWLGVTVESPEYGWRVDYLRSTPAAVRFISVEPLLASFADYPGVLDDMNWIICGAETGPGKRPMRLDWARSLRDQCQEANIPFFFKKDSNGNRELDGQLWEEYPYLKYENH